MNVADTDSQPSALDVVTAVVASNSDIAAVRFVQYPPAQTFKEIQERKALTADDELRRRLRHVDKTIREYVFSRREIADGLIGSVLSSLPADNALAVTSRVTLADGRMSHIPMIDFQCRNNSENLAYLRSAMLRLDTAGGFLLVSGNSFHFYGLTLLAHEDWVGFVGRSLLLEPLVDVRYLGHCLLDGFASLRISRHSSSRRDAPVVVKEILT